MLEARFGPWGIVGVNLKPPRLGDLLEPQDHLYSRTLREGERMETRVIGAIRATIDVLDAASAAAAVTALAAPAVQVVTMTVTEKGYCLTPSSGELDDGNLELQADLGGADPPRTLLGLLAGGLECRRRTGGGGITLISCDNVPSNGARLRAGLSKFAAKRSASLAKWVEKHVAFPSTMVDRIVPATTLEDVEAVSLALGVRDEAAVGGETFRQWVIEDKFAAERPPWDLAGAQFVSNAEPYEQIKMRVLNGAQSTLSHQGALLGLVYSYEAAADPMLGALTRGMLERETATTLPKVSGMEAVAYIETSLARIRNPAIRHRCHQIGTDGSQKIAQRILDPLRERLAAGQGAELLILSAASWMAYVLAGGKRFGARWAPLDPWAETVIAIGNRAGAFLDIARETLTLAPIFGIDLARRPDVAKAVAQHLEGLLGGDPRAYLTRLLGER